MKIQYRDKCSDYFTISLDKSDWGWGFNAKAFISEIKYLEGTEFNPETKEWKIPIYHESKVLELENEYFFKPLTQKSHKYFNYQAFNEFRKKNKKQDEQKTSAR